MTAPIHPIIREALAAHEVFRKLGFTPDEIFVRPSPELFVTVRRGGLELNLSIGTHAMNVDDTVAAWTAGAEWWNTTNDEAARHELYEGSATRRNLVPLMVVLKNKGFAVHRSDA